MNKLFGGGNFLAKSYAKETFDSTPEVVGGLDVVANKSALGYLPRTFVGVRDDHGNGTKETVIFYSSSYARTPNKIL